MNTRKIPSFHNPNNLTPEQYGVSEGWRLLRVSELGTRPEGVEFKRQWDSRWRESLPVGVINDDVSYRTLAPDPYAPKNEWVKMSDRKPNDSDFPAMFGAYTTTCGWTQIYCDRNLITDRSWTHWFSTGKIPAPPARELTQAERDDAAYAKFFESSIGDVSMRTSFNAGVAYARTSAK